MRNPQLLQLTNLIQTFDSFPTGQFGVGKGEGPYLAGQFPRLQPTASTFPLDSGQGVVGEEKADKERKDFSKYFGWKGIASPAGGRERGWRALDTTPLSYTRLDAVLSI